MCSRLLVRRENIMLHPRPSGIRLFVDRLLSHSVLDTAEQAAILALPSQAQLARRNEDLVQPGETVGHSCLVADGLVASFGASRDGKRQITSFFVPGDMVDLLSVVTPKAGHALQALTPTTILTFAHADLRKVAARHPAVAEAFWRDTAIASDIFAQWVVNVGSRLAATRMAHCLCELSLRMERARVGTKERFPMLLTQPHLADALGLTSVHVNRTLGALKAKGVLSVVGGELIVHDWGRLAEIGEFDASYLRLHDEPLRLGCFGPATGERPAV
jgi:CRP-like cAMP-binding protein